jgi:tRNA 5-methylaminomethyl-2-thiouridine biosynthesis bifunctional protein
MPGDRPVIDPRDRRDRPSSAPPPRCRRHTSSARAQRASARHVAPWLQRPPARRDSRTAIVIGGGLAGTSAAASLAARGLRVTLVDRHPALAAEASGNAQGVLYIKPSPHGTALTALSLAGVSFALRELVRRLPADGTAWSQCGVVVLAHDIAEADRHAQLAALGWPRRSCAPSTRAPPRTSPVSRCHPADSSTQPRAGCIRRRSARRSRTTRASTCASAGPSTRSPATPPMAGPSRTPRATRCTPTSSWSLRRSTPRDSRPRAPAAQADPRTDHDGPGDGGLHPARDGALRRKLRGAGAQRTPLSRRDLRRRRRRDGPPRGRRHRQPRRAACPRPGAGRCDRNLRWRRHTARASGRRQPDPQQPRGSPGRDPDYLPIAGAALDADRFRERFAALARDATTRFDEPAPWLPGLFVSTGHGSRGLVTAPIAGELIAALVTGEPLPLPTNVVQALATGRFLARDLKRRQSAR